jgi:hypothetical protein
MKMQPRVDSPESSASHSAGASASSHRPWSLDPRRPLAFTLVEVLVAVSLLSVIVLGLMMMFNQTQKAFRLGMMQTDVLENGRLTTDLLSRELEQITPGNSQFSTSFVAELAPPTRLGMTPTPVQLDLPPSPTLTRTDMLQQIYFVTHENQSWKAIGYLVDTPQKGLGTLYRFEFPTYRTNQPDGLMRVFDNDAQALYNSGNVSSNLRRIMDGVVVLNTRLYDTAGYEINQVSNTCKNATVFTELALANKPRAQFFSNAVPAYVEFELGVLEPSVLEKYKSIPVPAIQAQFLKDQISHVHVFRQRVAVRNVDPSAYQ